MTAREFFIHLVNPYPSPVTTQEASNTLIKTNRIRHVITTTLLVPEIYVFATAKNINELLIHSSTIFILNFLVYLRNQRLANNSRKIIDEELIARGFQNPFD